MFVDNDTMAFALTLVAYYLGQKQTIILSKSSTTYRTRISLPISPLLPRRDTNPQLLPRRRHKPLIPHNHHLLRRAMQINLDMKPPIQGTHRQQQLHTSQMHADTVARTGLKGPIHDLHLCGGGVPAIGEEFGRVGEDGFVAVRAVGEVADYDAGGDVLAADDFAGGDAWGDGWDWSAEA